LLNCKPLPIVLEGGVHLTSLGTIKRGDSFSFTATILDSVTGNPLSGIAGNLKCQGRHHQCSSELLAEMEISETSTSGEYLFVAPSTSNWQPKFDVCFDIQYTGNSGVISSSETFCVSVEGDITK